MNIERNPMFKNKRSYFILLLILLLAAALRFYRLPDMVGFDFDQEYAANFAYNVLKVYPIQLIGQGLSVQGLFMGPWYFYYLVPFFAATNLHPIGGYIGSIVLGLITIFAYYFLVKDVFNEKAGLIAAFLRAVLYNKVEDDWGMAPSLSSDLAVLISWYCIYKYWKGKTVYLIPLGFVFGLFTSFHPVLFPLYFVFLIVFFLKRKLPSKKVFVLSFVAFILPLLPLFLFEYFHNFLEIKQLFSLSSTGKSEVKTIQQLFEYADFNFFNSYYLFGVYAFLFIPKLLFSFAFFAGFFVLIFKKVQFWKEKFHGIIFCVTLFGSILYYVLLPIHVTDYYFMAATTIVFIYTSASLALLTSKKLTPILFVILGIIFTANILLISQKWNNKGLIDLGQKDAIVKEILKRQQDKEFYVSYVAELGWKWGFEYLFKVYGHPPLAGGAKPPVYVIIVPLSQTQEKPDIIYGDIGLVLPKEKNP